MDYILYFFIYSVLGWVLETGFAFVTERRFVVRRNLLKSPMCPVYGLGAVFLILTLKPVSDSPLLLFCGGFLVASCVEFIYAMFWERFYNVRLWDYRAMSANLGGKVCAWFSLCWGVISILFIRFLEPAVSGAVSALPAYQKLLFGSFFCIYFLVDLSKTAKAYKAYGRYETDELEQVFTYVKRYN